MKYRIGTAINFVYDIEADSLEEAEAQAKQCTIDEVVEIVDSRQFIEVEISEVNEEAE